MCRIGFKDPGKHEFFNKNLEFAIFPMLRSKKKAVNNISLLLKKCWEGLKRTSQSLKSLIYAIQDSTCIL
jgi:hypothetical protein